MTERLSRDAREFEERLNKQDVAEGDVLIFEWSPYGWAAENEGYVARHYVRVTDVHDFTGDVKLRTPDGKTLTDLGEGRAQVMGDASHTGDVPDRTDVGRGGTYYPTDVAETPFEVDD